MQKPKLLFPLLLLLGAALSGLVAAEPTQARQIDRLVHRFADEGRFSGVLLASVDGRVIYQKGFGLANADFNIPNRLDTRIGIASITKYMTTIVLTRLVEQEVVSRDDTVSKYIPGFPSGDRITIELLADHRAGIPHRVMPTEYEATRYTSQEMVDKIKAAELDFEPGARRGYSSAGYTLLTRILEIASGKSYAELLRQYVFEPAGMKDTVDFDGEKIMARRAQDYVLRPDGIVNAPLKDYGFLVGAGSVFSTVGDMLKFGEAVLDGTYGEAAHNQLVEDERLSASGKTNGHRAYLEIDREKKYAFVLLSNLASGAFDVISQGLGEILKGEELTVGGFRVPELDLAGGRDLSEYVGTYERTRGQFVIVLVDGVLHSGDIGIYPTKSKDCFFDYTFFGDVCFGRDDSGKIEEIVWKGVNFELRGVRP